MPKKVTVRPGVKAVFETYTASTPSDTLVINAHGMQHQNLVALPSSPALPKRNFAFTVGFDKALYNEFFKKLDNNLYNYVKAFKKSAGDFSSIYPELSIYPFYDDTTWRRRFELLVTADICDSIHFMDFEIGESADCPDAISLGELLTAPYWGSGGGTVNDHYTSILLLTCRSNQNRGIGMGGAPVGHSDGLYKVDGKEKPHIAMASS